MLKRVPSIDYVEPHGSKNGGFHCGTQVISKTSGSLLLGNDIRNPSGISLATIVRLKHAIALAVLIRALPIDSGLKARFRQEFCQLRQGPQAPGIAKGLT